jgi:hypothetical protein
MDAFSRLGEMTCVSVDQEEPRPVPTEGHGVRVQGEGDDWGLFLVLFIVEQRSGSSSGYHRSVQRVDFIQVLRLLGSWAMNVTSCRHEAWCVWRIGCSTVPNFMPKRIKVQLPPSFESEAHRMRPCPVERDQSYMQPADIFLCIIMYTVKTVMTANSRLAATLGEV